MKKAYSTPAVETIAYQPQAAIANGSAVDGEFDMDILSPQAGI